MLSTPPGPVAHAHFISGAAAYIRAEEAEDDGYRTDTDRMWGTPRVLSRRHNGSSHIQRRASCGYPITRTAAPLPTAHRPPSGRHPARTLAIQHPSLHEARGLHHENEKRHRWT